MYMTCGLVFNKDKNAIAMIRKNRPMWQYGKLNGEGGKVERSETFIECMIREAKEEMSLENNNWYELAQLSTNNHTVCFFATFGVDFSKIVQKTDEEIVFVDVSYIFNTLSSYYYQIMPNIKTMIGLALDISNEQYNSENKWSISA